jgi:Cu(I)/Ag(I) efflux system protein CusF
MQKITLITTLSVLSLAACSPQAPEPAVSAPVAETPAAPAMADMPMAAEPQAAAGPITSMGKITAIDAAVDTVTLDHQAIPEVKWDAMSMGFTTTDPAMLKDLKVGDMVVFDLVSAAEPSKISRIAKQ